MNRSVKLVVVGTSTGGPRALQEVLSRLPADFPAPLLIVQHMPEGFTRSFAGRLHETCPIAVSEAVDGEAALSGHAYIAPGDFHMTVDKDRGYPVIRLHKGPPVNGHRPSVDVLFESAAAFGGESLVGVLLTGMGSDGARGLRMIRDCGGRTIAESEETCAVFGMPRAAIAMRAAEVVLPLPQIAPAIRARLHP